MATTAVAKLNAMFNAESVQKQFHNALKGHKDVFIASIIVFFILIKHLNDWPQANLLILSLQLLTL